MLALDFFLWDDLIACYDVVHMKQSLCIDLFCLHNRTNFIVLLLKLSGCILYEFHRFFALLSRKKTLHATSSRFIQAE